MQKCLVNPSYVLTMSVKNKCYTCGLLVKLWQVRELTTLWKGCRAMGARWKFSRAIISSAWFPDSLVAINWFYNQDNGADAFAPTLQVLTQPRPPLHVVWMTRSYFTLCAPVFNAVRLRSDHPGCMLILLYPVEMRHAFSFSSEKIEVSFKLCFLSLKQNQVWI